MKNKHYRKLPVYQQLLIIIILLILAFFIQKWNQIPKDDVTLSRCVDGDTAVFKVKGTEEKVRFIGVDTPELTSNDYYAKEASDYTCERLKSGTIKLEYDSASDERDKFGRLIAWVYVDDELLQRELVAGGYAKVRYIYDDYMYVDELNRLQRDAKKKKLGIWE
ncbi:thermonuclease [Erysipelothrix sp. HDW6C]|uniref:thermonuclease family protein n=1 Tax=Erysipelothrix sp. HDW6C TaxID=2714930 RepID=UPI00140B668B|nr:thermonuclease family protein [Erysipelothrix sp. HDW6C]QIK69781.1 thermonuclease [Erysipelothrix sp. HDW6C]